MGGGRAPIESHLFKLAKASVIPNNVTRQIIEQVKSAVILWPAFAKEANVSAQSLQYICKEWNM